MAEYKKDLDILEAISKLKDKNIKDLESEIEFLKVKSKLIEDNNQKQIVEQEIKTKEIELTKEGIKQQEQEIKNNLEIMRLDVEKKDLDKHTLEIRKKDYEQTKEESIVKLKNLDILKKSIEEEENKLELLERQKETQASFSNDIANVITNFTGIKKGLFEESFFGKVGSLGFGNSLKLIGRELKETITLKNLFASSLEKIQESTLELMREQDQAISSFNKATGASGEYDKMIVSLGHDHLALGIDTQEAAQAIQSIKENFTDFNLVGKSTQKELSLLSATFNELGISNDLTAKNIQISTKVLGMSTDQAMIAQKEIFATAKSLGIAPAKMAQDFAQAMPKLAAFGDKAKQVFRELSVVSKATGMEIDKLISITEKFDTFEGAADSVGRLNTILGGAFLDSMEMIKTTDPTERIKLLRNAVDQSGKSFTDMEYYEKKAMASAMGMSDVSELSKILSGDLEKQAAAAKVDAISQEQLAEMSKKVQSITDKLKQTFMSFAVSLEPVIRGIKWLVDGFLKLNDIAGGKLIPIIVSVIGFVILAKKAMGLYGIATGIAALFTGKKIAMDTASIGPTLGATAATQAQGKAATSSALGMIAFGVAALLVGAGVAIAALGIAQLAKAMSMMSGTQVLGLVAILAILALGIAAVGLVSGIAVIPTLAFGAAILLIGAGVALMFYGMSLFVKSLTGLFVAMKDGASIMPKLVGYMFLLAASIAALGVAGLLAMISFPIIVLGLMGIAYALTYINPKNLEGIQALGNVFKSLVDVSSTVTAIQSVSLAIQELVAALDKIPIDKTVTFTTAMQAITALPEVRTEVVENTKKIVDQAIRYRETQEVSKAKGLESLGDLLLNVNSTSTTSKSEGSNKSGERTIILNLDGRILKKFVVDVMNENMNPRRIS